MIKKIISKLLFQNKYALKINHIGENSKVGLLHNFLNGQYISIGNHTSIGRYARMHCYDRYNGQRFNPRIEIGSECIFGPCLTILAADLVKIEDHVAFAGYVTIVNENHGMNVEDNVPFYRQTLTSAPVIIGEGSWIGERCCILPGVTIGKKCIIGSGSVVTKSIPDYSIAVGNPARVVKTWNFETHKWEKIETL